MLPTDHACLELQIIQCCANDTQRILIFDCASRKKHSHLSRSCWTCFQHDECTTQKVYGSRRWHPLKRAPPRCGSWWPLTRSFAFMRARFYVQEGIFSAECSTSLFRLQSQVIPGVLLTSMRSRATLALALEWHVLIIVCRGSRYTCNILTHPIIALSYLFLLLIPGESGTSCGV